MSDATPSCPPPAAVPVTVVGPQFTAAHPVDLLITEKLMHMTEGHFAVTDVNGDVVFKVRGAVFRLHNTRLLLDSADRPLAHLRQKMLSAHTRWQVFRGESSDAKDLLFSVKRSNFVPGRTQFDVILAANTNEDRPDFKVQGSWLERSCTIYHGDNPSDVIAQMHRNTSIGNLLIGKDVYAVTVNPNIDQAFIVTLIVLLYEINKDRIV